MKTEKEYAYYPLTLFDGMFKDAGVVTGWFVEGLLDLTKIEAALHRLTMKWPMLAGRLESTDKLLFQIKVPLGLVPFPAGYSPFVLTSRVSDVPIDKFVQLPLPTVSDVLPSSLFMHSTAPRAPGAWVSKQLPLTYWHLTYFKQRGCEYTCIGVTFPHGLFDGMGIAAVVHALEAETLGRPWAIPPTLHAGRNENQMQSFLDRMQENVKKLPANYRAASVVGLWFIITFMAWHLWQQLWHKARSRLILVPAKAYEKLVRDAREAMVREGKKDVRLSTGDVLTAWLYKTVYFSEEEYPTLRVHLSNMASLRVFSDVALKQYAHNCFIPIPYPILTVAELKATPVHSLAYKLASVRSALSLGHAIQVYTLLQDSVKPSSGFFNFRAVLPYDPSADESMSMSNMSIARIVDIDWSGVGGGRTICRYKTILSESPILISNIVTIAGRLDDGSTVLDVVLNRRRMRSLEEGVAKLIKAADESTVCTSNN
ncbi:hypothetical protein BDZ97DRAFT_1667587 [Flammula alnicola]|nr:hypothetical protein BDZ97DRAFT_1667587 [Flammula alnicola]